VDGKYGAHLSFGHNMVRCRGAGERQKLHTKARLQNSNADFFGGRKWKGILATPQNLSRRAFS
jgi:hypothetical protein